MTTIRPIKMAQPRIQQILTIQHLQHKESSNSNHMGKDRRRINSKETQIGSPCKLKVFDNRTLRSSVRLRRHPRCSIFTTSHSNRARLRCSARAWSTMRTKALRLSSRAQSLRKEVVKVKAQAQAHQAITSITSCSRATKMGPRSLRRHKAEEDQCQELKKTRK